MFETDPRIRHSFWTLIFGGAVMKVGFLGIHQANVQRIASISTLKAARKYVNQILLKRIIYYSIKLLISSEPTLV